MPALEVFLVICDRNRVSILFDDLGRVSRPSEPGEATGVGTGVATQSERQRADVGNPCADQSEPGPAIAAGGDVLSVGIPCPPSVTDCSRAQN
jgi:hypothetical protein